MTTHSFTCTLAKQIDMVDYLESLGYVPQKIRNQDYWYLSPMRSEKNPSFKINRNLNVWYDHGEGTGGDIIDFGTSYFSCSVSEFLNKLEQQKSHLSQQNFLNPLSFHPHPSEVANHVEAGEKKIKVVAANPLEDHRLCRYLQQRKIPMNIAKQYTKEISFELNEKIHKAIGLQNQSGGWELRNDYFKGGSSPKDLTFIQRNVTDKKGLIVVEGMFDLLSYLSLCQEQKLLNTSILILNSLSFFERARQQMEPYPEVHLYLDRDHAGRKLTESVIQMDNRYLDKSHLYQGYKDLNDWLVKNYPHPTQKLNMAREPRKKRRRHLRL